MVRKEEAAIRASWDANAAAWAEAVRHGRIESRVRVTDAAVIAAIQRTGGLRVLDIGCGEGWLCRALTDLHLVPTGIDGSATLIAEARGASKADYRLLGYEEFSAEPALAGGPFDTAVCNFSLLGEAIQPILRAAAAVLARGGGLVIQTLHPFAALEPGGRYEDGWRTEDFSGMGGAFQAPMPWFYRTIASWTAQVSAAGFELVACEETVGPDTGKPLSLLLTGKLMHERPQRGR